MKKTMFGFLAIFLFYNCATAQVQEDKKLQLLNRLTFDVKLVLQGFSLPVSGVKAYWQSKGVSLGVAYDWNHKGSLQQVLTVGSVFSKYHGSAQFVSTAFQFNPLHNKSITTGISLGAGYMYVGTYNNGWRQESTGEWKNTSNKVGLLYVPASLQIGVKTYENSKFIVIPTLSYQLNAVINYSPTKPVLPQVLLSVGSKIKLK
jgi:hypothetical protein